MKQHFQRQLDELPRIFRFLDDASIALHLDADARFALSLAVEELFTNVLKHNPTGQGPIEIEIGGDADSEVGPGRLMVTFTDPNALPFDPTTVPAVDTRAPLHERKPGGLGLHILSHVMDSVVSEQDGRINRIHLSKSLPGPEPDPDADREPEPDADPSPHPPPVKNPSDHV